MNETHHDIVCVDINLLSKKISTIEKKMGTVLITHKEVFLLINSEKTERIFMSYEQAVGSIYSIKIGNKFFENVTEIRYLETTPSKLNLQRN